MRSESVSEWRVANRGYPQGSNLGSLFWNIFQNYLVQDIHECRLMTIQVYSAGEMIEDVETIYLEQRGNPLKGINKTYSSAN